MLRGEHAAVATRRGGVWEKTAHLGNAVLDAGRSVQITPAAPPRKPLDRGRELRLWSPTASRRATSTTPLDGETMRSFWQAHTTLTRPLARRRARNEKGLTTLEWLLIVAAVAGLAALAIVLVQGVVDDTAEDIRGSSARGQAALVASQAIIDQGAADFNATSIIGDGKFENQAEWALYYNSKCRRLGITYSDSDIKVKAQFAVTGTVGTVLAATVAGNFSVAPSDALSACYITLPG